MTNKPQMDTNWTPVRMMEAPNRRYLILLRTGNTSLHKQWIKDLNGVDRNWDLLLSHFGTDAPDCTDADVIVQQGAIKFAACHRLFQDLPWLYQYQAVCLCDDDLMTSWSQLNRMFELFEEYNLDLAQPSLTPDSFYSHPICLQQEKYTLRFTNFVEIMVPIFSAKVLPLCVPTLADVVFGWGLDWVWPHLLGNPKNKIAILDAVSVKHTRPAAQGPIYKDAKEQTGVNAHDEMAEILARYKVPRSMQTYGYMLAQPENSERPAEAAGQIDFVRLDGLVAAAARVPAASPWQGLSDLTQFLPDWQSNGGTSAQAHEIPLLQAQDAVMNFGLRFMVLPLAGNDIEIMQIGDDRQQACVLLLANPDAVGKFRLTLRLFDQNRQFVDMSVPGLPLSGLVTMAVQLVPSAGYIKIWFNGQLVGQSLAAPWQWCGAQRVWLGSKRLAALLQSCWISPSIVPQKITANLPA